MQNTHDRIEIVTMLLTLIAALLAAIGGCVGAGFLLFVAAVTPIPMMVGSRMARSLQALWMTHPPYGVNLRAIRACHRV